MSTPSDMSPFYEIAVIIPGLLDLLNVDLDQAHKMPYKCRSIKYGGFFSFPNSKPSRQVEIENEIKCNAAHNRSWY